MSKIDEFKKKYKIQSVEEEEEQKASSSPIEEFKKKYNITTTDESDKLGSYERSKRESKTAQVISSNFDRMGSSTGIDGYKKYLEDEEAKKTAPKYDLNNDGQDAWWEKALGYLGGGGGGVVDTSLPTAGETQAVHDLREDESYKRPSKDWSVKQKSEFGELYLTSPESAFAYAAKTNKQNNKRKEESEIDKIQREATKNFGYGVGHTVGAIATAPFGLADYLGDLANAAAGRDIAPDGSVSPFEYSQAVKDGISTHLNEIGGTLDENIPIFGGKGWGDVYGLGMSYAQSVASAYTLGGAGALVSYFGQGAAAGVDDAIARGASDDQALLYGAALGTFEGVAEMVGIDNLFKLGSASTVKGLIKNVLKQAGAEGAEEGLTSILSNIADNVIMQGESNFNILVEELMAQGMSEADAKKKAWMSTLGDIAFDTIAGAVSGSVSGGIHSGINTAITNADAKANYSGQAQDMVSEALASEDADTRTVGEKYQKKLNDNKKLSGWNISHLLETTDTQKVKSAVEAQLTKLGESGDVSALAEVITKQTQGIELSKKEQAIIDGSKFGQRVVNTLKRENIKSGEYDTRWAKDIGTRRLNADVYNKSLSDHISDAVDAERKARLELRETDSVTENAIIEGNAMESEISASVGNAKNATTTVAKAKMVDTEGNEVEVKPQRFATTDGGEMGVEVEDGKVVAASEVDFGESDIGLVRQAAVDMSSRVGGFSVDTANVFVNGYNEASGQSAGEYIDGWISAYKFGAMKTPPPLSALAANPKTSQLTEEQRKNAYNFGRAFGNEPVAVNKKSEGFVGEYTKRSYNSEQAELLSALPVEALQNAVDSNGAVSFNTIGLGGDTATQQKWIDAGLTYTEDGKVYVDENAVLDERDRRRNASKQAKIASTGAINANKDSQKASERKKGRVIFDGAKYGKTLNERQRASLKALNFIAKALGKDIYVEKLGKGDNGWYDPTDRSIHVDLYAGAEAEALMLFTVSHELTHDIRATLPEKFNALADAVFEEYSKRYDEHTMEDLIDAKINELKETGDITEDMTEEEAYDYAYEEVICDCLETMLVDSDAMTALSKNIYAKDKGLWQRIKDFFARLVARIKAAYADVIPDSEEGQRFRDLGKGAERIKKLWVEAIVELSEVDKTTGEGKVKHSYSSIAYSFFGDKKVTVKDFENGSYTETEGYKRYVDNCLNNMRQTIEGFNESEARQEIVNSIDGIVKVAVAMKKAGYDILDNHAKRSAVDSKNRLLFSSLEPNSDYFTSSDISTICDKRINFAEIYDEIVRREEALGVPKGKRFFDNVDNYFILHKIMADKGLTQPCRQCYVESMRKNLAPMANAFLELMQETDPNNKANKQLYQPSGKSKGELKSNNAKLRENLLETIAEEEYTITANDLTVEMLTTEDGLAQLKLQAPLIYEAFNSFYGQSKPKMPKSATPFRFGELTAMLTDNKGKIKKSLIDKIMSTGGFRLQSYSDFQIQNFADVLQVIFEAGTLGLSGHAYTKVPAFLDATKGTNLKRNISIFMYNDGGEWKIDRNDSFPYDLDKIYDIVKSDKQGNTSIIAVSQNEMMSAFIMANDNIGYFIPFHKSGMKMGTVRETTVKEGGREIKGYSGIKDHTRQQTEVWAKNTADHKANTKVKKGINIYEFWDFDNVDNLSREGLIEKNVRAYIDACNEAGYLPKFREYVMNNSKVLNAVLSYAKQLGFVSQNATIDDISFEYKGYRIPYGYYKCLGDFGMFTPDGEASPIERLSLKDYDFDEAEAFFSNAESLRRNEILQQIANGEERERYRNSDMTTAEIAEEVQSKRNQVVEEVVSGEYKKVKHSRSALEKSDYAIEERTFSYDELISKDDLVGVVIRNNSQVPLNADGSIDAQNIVAKVRKECQVIQTRSASPTYFLNVPDIDRNVQIVEKSITHGFFDSTKKNKTPSPRDLINAKVSLALPEILASSIEVNRSYREGNVDIPYSHIMMGTVGIENDAGTIEYYAVRSVIEERKNLDPILVEAKVLGRLHAVNAKKIDSPNLKVAEISVARGYDEVYTYSIADFLEDVKGVFEDTFSADVYNKLGTIRKGNDFSKNLMYQHQNTNSMKPRTLLANALEGAVTEDERNLLQTYKDNIDKLNSEQEKLDKVMSEIDEIRYKKSLSILGEEMSVKTFESRAKAKAEKNGINAEDVQFKLDRSNSKYIAYAVGHGTILEADKTFRSAEDNAKLNELWGEAKDISAQINTYDRELLKLQAMQPIKEVLKREKAQAVKWAEEKAEVRRKESVARVKESAAKTQRELMDRYQENRKRGVESRNKTAMRHKIRNVVKDLNKLLNRGTKDKNVKEELKETVASSLALAEVIFSNDISNEDIVRLGVDSVTEKESKLLNEYSDLLDTIDALGDKREYFYGTEKVREELLAKVGSVEEQIAKVRNRLTSLNRQLSDVFERERARLNKATASQLMKNLAEEYQKLKDSDTDYIRAAYDEYIFTRLDALKDSIGGTIARDMSLAQLTEVYDAYKMVEHFVRNANKAFKSQKGEAISVIANGVLEELDKLPEKLKFTKMGKKLSKRVWDNLKPVYALERIGSAAFMRLYNNVRTGEDVWAVDMAEAQAFLEEQKSKYDYGSFDFDKKYTFTSSTGKDFELTLGQIMSLYAYSKRGGQAKEHLEYGGFVFDSDTEVKEKKAGVEITYELNDPTAYKLNDAILGEITKVITDNPNVKGFADAMQDYLSTVMGEKGNEVSMELYGIKQFKEEDYFPLKTSHQYLERAREQATQTGKIKNKGFTKQTQPHARTQIMLSSFMDVWAGHVNEMSMYHAFTLPLEDFYRVYNYSTPNANNLDTAGVIPFIEKAHGTAATEYVDQLLKDLNGGAKSDPRETDAKALMSLFKKASVMASLSVVVQQPSAIVRAQALVDAKYFVGKKVSSTKHKETWAEVKKYAPVAVIKEMGYFDVGMGQSSIEWLKGDKTWRDKMDDALSKAPAFADELAWVSIWNAVKRENAHNNPTLKTNSEEFLKLAAERFTEVIVKTQVYDSTLARSANMRSKSAFMSMWTAFMAEPTTSINMLQDAFKKGNKKMIARTIGAVYGSVVLNAALVSLVYAMRDDDEDETFLEKYLSRFTTEVIDGINPLTYIPGIKDVWSLAQGYDIERADMSIISDLFGSLQQLTKAALKYSSDMSEEELAEYKKELTEKILGVTDSLASLTGVPVKNIRRDINGIINGFKTIKADIEGRETTAGSLGDNILDDVKDSVPVWGWLPDEKKGDKLYDAIIKGDKAYEERLKSGYKNDTAINSAIRKALRENDPRVRMAAECLNAGDLRRRDVILDTIVAEGHFDEKLVGDAIRAEANAIKEESEGDSADSSDNDKDEAYSIYQANDINVAFESGDTALAKEIIQDLIDTKVANGMEEKKARSSLRSSMTSYWKPIYKTASQAEKSRIRKILYNSGLYGTVNDVVKTAQDWLKD